MEENQMNNKIIVCATDASLDCNSHFYARAGIAAIINQVMFTGEIAMFRPIYYEGRPVSDPNVKGIQLLEIMALRFGMEQISSMGIEDDAQVIYLTDSATTLFSLQYGVRQKTINFDLIQDEIEKIRNISSKNRFSEKVCKIISHQSVDDWEDATSDFNRMNQTNYPDSLVTLFRHMNEDCDRLAKAARKCATNSTYYAMERCKIKSEKMKEG